MDSELAQALARIEQRQAAYEVVAHRLIGMLEVHNEKLDAILEATTVEPGPSPTTEVLKQILERDAVERDAENRLQPAAILDRHCARRLPGRRSGREDGR